MIKLRNNTVYGKSLIKENKYFKISHIVKKKLGKNIQNLYIKEKNKIIKRILKMIFNRIC